MQYETANLSEEEQAEIDKRARELFEAEHGRYQGETDAQFEKRYQKYKQKYWAMAATEKVREKVKASADGSDEGAMSLINSTLGDDGMISKFSSSMEAVDDSVQAGGLQSLLESLSSSEKKSKGAARYESDNGAIMWTDMYKPEVRKNQGSGWSRNAPQSAYQLVLDEFFRNTVAPTIKITGAFKKYLDPVDDDMVGTRGEEHSGADFTIGGNPEIHATTGGRVVEVGIDNDHFGNYVKIQDIGGDYHIYAHLKDVKVSEGDEIEGGDVIGTMGHTGSSQIILKQSDNSRGDTSLIQSGDRLHYEIRNSDNEILNPFTFFKYKRGGGKNGSVTLDPQEAMIRAASEVFVKAAEASSNPGHLYHNVTSAKNITFDDGFTIDQIAPTHCTSMMGAVVKRMGYYTYPGSGYTETHQGEDYMGGDVAKKWGVSGSVGKAKIYNRDGSISDDWETGPVSNWQPGDIMFTSTGNAHAHMPVFKATNGPILGFNGGADDSSANSIKLAQYYLENGKIPDDVAYNETSTLNVDKDGCHDHNVSDQIGAIAGPLKYYIRYVGDPVTFMSDEDGDYDDYENFDSGDYMDDDSYINVTSGVAAGNNARSSAASAIDKTSGTPYSFSTLQNGKIGTATNKANQKLFDYYVPYNNYTSDYNTWLKKHPKYTKWIATGPSGSKTIWIADDGYALTTAGNNAKAFIKTGVDQAKQQSKSSVISTAAMSDNDLRKVWKSIFTMYSQSYANKLSRADMIRSFNDAGASASHNGHRVMYDTNVGQLYYRGYPGNYVRVEGNQIIWPDISKVQTNNGTNVINPGTNTSFPTSETTVTDAFKAQSYVQNVHDAAEAWRARNDFWNNYGSGDESTVIPDVNLGNTIADQIMSMADTSDQSGTPIIVNQYASQQPVDGSDPINAILTNTYNVRSEKIESILENMLTLMKERNQRKRNQQSASSLGLSTRGDEASGFSNDDIPQSVERLSVG